MRDLFLVAVVIGTSLYALHRPAFGMLSFVCFSLLNPHSWTWSFGQHFPFVEPLALCTLVGWLLSAEPKRIPLQREAVLVLALWVLFGLSTLGAEQPERAREVLIHVSKILLLVFVSTALINSEARLHALIKVIALSLGFHGLNGGLWFVATGGSHMVFGPEESFLAANNMIGLALAMNVPLLVYLGRRESRRWLRRILFAMALFSYPAVIGTFSRGAWLGLAGATLIMVLRSKRRISLSLAVVVLCLAVMPLMPSTVVGRYDTLVHYEEEGSAQSRFWNWRFATKVALAHPLLGAGFDYYGLEAYERYFPEFLERWPGKVWSCHSIWLTMLSEHGFSGLFLWIALLVCTLWSLRQLRRESRRGQRPPWAADYAEMLQAALVAFLISGSFVDAAYFDLLYQLIAVVVIIKEVTPRFAVAAAGSDVTVWEPTPPVTPTTSAAG